MFQEFKAFIQRGNVLDLAVAVIMGGAFGAIVSALVDNILTPIIGLLMGGVNFSGLGLTIGEATIGYGAFIQAIIDFVIVAFVIFMIVRAVNNMSNKEEEAPAPPEPTDEAKLLTEIRDLLANR